MIKKNSNFIDLIIMNQFPLDLQLIILRYAIGFIQENIGLIIKILMIFPELKEKKIINWNEISKYKKLNEDFIREFKDKVNWYNISQFQTLNEDFIREFQNEVYWELISSEQNLSEDFIREFQDKVNWKNISVNQKLSEDFIREFQNKVDWYGISLHQEMSVEFMEEFKNKITIPITIVCYPYRGFYNLRYADLIK